MPTANQSPVLRAAVSVTQMAKMLSMSRSRLYDLVRKGIFAAPVYSLTTKRPFFPRESQELNLKVRAEQQGVNGEFVLFQERRAPVEPSGRSIGRRNGLASSLLQPLRSLGLDGVDVAAVERALMECFPTGTDGQEDAAVLRSIFRHLRRPGTA
jgi:hypothetical protein